MKELITNTPIRKWAILPTLITITLSFCILRDDILNLSFFYLVIFMLITAIGFFLLYGVNTTKVLNKPLKPFKTSFLSFLMTFISILCIVIIEKLLSISTTSYNIVPIVLEKEPFLFLVKLIPSTIGKELLVFTILFIVVDFLIKFLSYKKAVIVGTTATVIIYSLLQLLLPHYYSLHLFLALCVLQTILIWASFRGNSIWISFTIAYAYISFSHLFLLLV